MAIKKILVKPADVRVGQIVDNRNLQGPLEVLNVEAFTDHGKVTYKISVGRNGEEHFGVELTNENTLTYTYLTS
jgi:hypothetical protein